MYTFSERYGYIKPSDVLIRESIPKSIQNAICSCYDEFLDDCRYNGKGYLYDRMEEELWTKFLNKRLCDFGSKSFVNEAVLTSYILDVNIIWYKKLDILEASLKNLNTYIFGPKDELVNNLNAEFERLHYAYRIVDNIVVEIVSKDEIKSIESTINNKTVGVAMHLANALKLFSQRPDADYRNSIKESISAVEAFCRECTSKNTLGEALSELMKKGAVIPSFLVSAFEKLYSYTNQPDTGIRHAFMDSNGKYVPSFSEALFMMVSCSAFINYLTSKVVK